MPKQKYYYAVVAVKSGKPVQFFKGYIALRTVKKDAIMYSNHYHGKSIIVRSLPTPFTNLYYHIQRRRNE